MFSSNNARACRQCGRALRRWQRYCSARCKWLHLRLPFRRCEWCHALFYPSSGEPLDNFGRRHYCHDGICRARGSQRRWYGLAGFAALLSVVCNAFAHDPEDQFGEWYRSLRAPATGLSCCSMERDCAAIDDYRGSATVPGGYEVRYLGNWLAVPADAVLQRTDNPTGHAVLCVLDSDGPPIARCFVRASDS